MPRTYRAERAGQNRKAQAEGWRSWQEKRYWQPRLDDEREVFRLGQRIDPDTRRRHFRYQLVGRRVVPAYNWKVSLGTGELTLAGSILTRAADEAIGTGGEEGPAMWHDPRWKAHLVAAARVA